MPEAPMTAAAPWYTGFDHVLAAPSAPVCVVRRDEATEIQARPHDYFKGPVVTFPVPATSKDAYGLGSEAELRLGA